MIVTSSRLGPSLFIINMTQWVPAGCSDSFWLVCYFCFLISILIIALFHVIYDWVFCQKLLLGYLEIGGYQMIVASFMGEGSQSNLTRLCISGALNDSSCRFATKCGVVPRNAMHAFRSVDDPNYPWTGMIFGLTISSIWYWCADQVWYGSDIHFMTSA